MQISAMIPPQFVKPLQAQVVKVGSCVEMEIKVTGNPTPEISWFKNGQPIKRISGYQIVKDNDISTLTIPQGRMSDFIALFLFQQQALL